MAAGFSSAACSWPIFAKLGCPADGMMTVISNETFKFGDRHGEAS
jgi:hypothetical protein